MKNFRLNVFDVVLLANDCKGIIKAINSNNYKAEIIDKKGNSIGIYNITNDDILEVLIHK